MLINPVEITTINGARPKPIVKVEKIQKVESIIGCTGKIIDLKAE